MAQIPPEDSSDTRSPLAIAYQWAWRVIAVALEMVFPGLMGYGLDVWLGTRALFVIIGFVLGMALGVWHLTRIAAELNSAKGKPR